MELILKRKYFKNYYIIGNLYIDGVFFSNTLEDTDRGLDSSMSEYDILKIKVKNKTAIPVGTYNITLDIVSPKFSKYSFYKKNANNGRLPRLLDVKGFEGILIHAGNSHQDTSGCILVGENREKGKLLNSRDTFIKLYNLLYEAYNKKETITIKIE